MSYETTTPGYVELNDDELESAGRLAQFHRITWAAEVVPTPIVDRSVVSTSTPLSALSARITQALKERGSLVVNLEKVPDDQAPTVASVVQSIIGRPIRVFDRHPHWRPIGVDLSRPPDRSEGVGRNGLHHDFVNASRPPRAVILYVERADPLGGGQSILSDTTDIELSLSPDSVATLRERRFRDGKVEALSNIGRDVNPFAVLTGEKRFPIRFTEGLLETAVGDELAALSELLEIILQRTVVIELGAKHLLAIEQPRTLHGRLPLGPDQATVTVDQRRILRHGFCADVSINRE